VDRTADDRREAVERGALAEALVADELVLNGWTVIARNWRGGGGEIDVIATRDGAVRFVEVKARSHDDPAPEDHVGAEKQRRLVRAAEAWLAGHVDPREACFLVAIVVYAADGKPAVTWYDDAFDG
jgi:putative endonuclease